MYDVNKIRQDFPILSRKVHEKVDLVYLDNGASAQKPKAVIDAVNEAYSHEYANVHRGLHFLSNLATDRYEGVRAKLAGFLGADEEEIIFTSGSTEAFNLVSYAWAAPRLEPGDEIILSVMEHHANIVPWHFLRERQGVVLKWIDVDVNGDLDPQAVIDAIGPKTKMICVTHMSNVLGTVVDVKTICHAARERGVVTVIDGSQSTVHMPVDVADIGCDFFAMTGHKLYGPSGSGALFARAARMAEMRPFMGGGDMINEVSKDRVTYTSGPLKFEAGTPPIVQMIGLGAAIDYVEGLGMENIAAHERDLRDYAGERLAGLNWLTVNGTSATKGAIFSFTMEGGAHPHDISTIIDRKGVAVRAGHHCCQPLMTHLGVSATCRASFGLYNTREEVDKLIDALELCHDLLG
ncbi:cysteine desulfurase [Rhodobacteraceae bacterium NNCM2]|nr:cysteine desulfurase [Coraliihabitans acroporae]